MKKAIIVVATAAALIATPGYRRRCDAAGQGAACCARAAASGWTGFYVGADAGLSATDAKWTATNFVQQLVVAGVPTGTMTGLNPILMSQAPAQHAIGAARRLSRLQLAIRAALAGRDRRRLRLDRPHREAPGLRLPRHGIIGFPSGADLSLRTTWDASARLRLGFLVTPTTSDLCDRRLRLAASGGDVLVQLADHLQRRRGQLRAVLASPPRRTGPAPRSAAASR